MEDYSRRRAPKVAAWRVPSHPRTVAWIRSFQNGSQELFVIPLGGGRERQLTHDGKSIDEVCWTRQGLVIFSSNRGGNSNLWAMRATGGPATQITKGAGPDLGMRMSADGKTLLYLQLQPRHVLWIASLLRSEPTRVPMDEATLGRPALSADGKEIAVPVFDSDPLQQRSHLVVMNRDGMNRRQITSGSELVSNPQWAPSGHRLAYVAFDADHADSSRIYVLDPSQPGTQRPIAYADGFRWVSADTLYAYRAGRMYRVPAEGGTMEAEGGSISWDGREIVYAEPRLASKLVLVEKLR